MATTTYPTPTTTHVALELRLYAGHFAPEEMDELCDGIQAACFEHDAGYMPRCVEELEAYSNSREEWAAYQAAHPAPSTDRTTTLGHMVTAKVINHATTLGLEHDDGNHDAVADFHGVTGSMPRCTAELDAWVNGEATYREYCVTMARTTPAPTLGSPKPVAAPATTPYELVKHDKVAIAVRLLESVIATVRDAAQVLATADCVPTLLADVNRTASAVCTTYNAVLKYQRTLAGRMQRAATSVKDDAARTQQLASKPAPMANPNAVLNAPKPQAEAPSKPVVMQLAAQTPVAAPTPKPVGTPVTVNAGGVEMAKAAIDKGTIGAMRTAVEQLGIVATDPKHLNGSDSLERMLRKWIATQTSKAGVVNCGLGITTKPIIAPATGTGETVPTPNEVKFADLRQECKKAGLKANGTKAELIERIAAHKATYNTPTPAPKLAETPKATPTTDAKERAELLAKLATLDTATLRDLVAAYATTTVKAAA